MEIRPVPYESPRIIDLGMIAEHTFDNPGKGDKSDNTEYETDKYGEYSHPFASAS